MISNDEVIAVAVLHDRIRMANVAGLAPDPHFHGLHLQIVEVWVKKTALIQRHLAQRSPLEVHLSRRDVYHLDYRFSNSAVHCERLVRMVPDTPHLNKVYPVLDELEFVWIKLCQTVCLAEIGYNFILVVHDDVCPDVQACGVQLYLAVGEMTGALV